MQTQLNLSLTYTAQPFEGVDGIHHSPLNVIHVVISRPSDDDGGNPWLFSFLPDTDQRNDIMTKSKLFVTPKLANKEYRKAYPTSW